MSVKRKFQWMGCALAILGLSMVMGCDKEYECTCVDNSSLDGSTHYVCAQTTSEAEDAARSECGDCVCACFDSGGECPW